MEVGANFVFKKQTTRMRGATQYYCDAVTTRSHGSTQYYSVGWESLPEQIWTFELHVVLGPRKLFRICSWSDE